MGQNGLHLKEVAIVIEEIGMKNKNIGIVLKCQNVVQIIEIVQEAHHAQDNLSEHKSQMKSNNLNQTLTIISRRGTKRK